MTYAELLEATRAEWGPAHRAYQDHADHCSECRPNSGRHCPSGLALRDQYDVAYMTACWTPERIAMALQDNQDLERLRIPLREAARAKRERHRHGKT